MKRKITYLLSILSLIVLLSGCLKSNPADDGTTVPLPEGIFGGTFTVIHLNRTKQTLDTTTVTSSITMSLSQGFAVSGDTTTIQAPSHGTYSGFGGTLVFNDVTFGAGATVNGPKKHLTGSYQYVYDGSSLQMAAQNDTLLLVYRLTK